MSSIEVLRTLPAEVHLIKIRIRNFDCALGREVEEDRYILVDERNRGIWMWLAKKGAEALASYVATKIISGIFKEDEQSTDLAKLIRRAIDELRQFIQEALEQSAIDEATRLATACMVLLRQYSNAPTPDRLAALVRDSNNLMFLLQGRGLAALVPFCHAVFIQGAALNAMRISALDKGNAALAAGELRNLIQHLDYSIAAIEQWIADLDKKNEVNISNLNQHWCEKVIVGYDYDYGGGKYSVGAGEAVRATAVQSPDGAVSSGEVRKSKPIWGEKCNFFWYADGQEVRYDNIVGSDKRDTWNIANQSYYQPAVTAQINRKKNYEEIVKGPLLLFLQDLVLVRSTALTEFEKKPAP